MMSRLLCVAAFLICVMPAAADDWPQWRGPNRTDVSGETGLLKSWPASGPKLLWTYKDAGNGFSAPAVVGNRFYTLGTEGGSECAIALDADTGKEIWKTKYGTTFKNGYGNGPRGSPTIAGDALYAVGGDSVIACIDLASGAKRWSVDMQADMKGKHQSGWGYTESPFVDGDRVICMPGGSEGTIAALDAKTGKVIWRCKEVRDDTSYSSIIAAEVEGVKQYIAVTASAVVGVAAEDGKLLWRYAPERRFTTATIPTPIYRDGSVFVTAGYNAGCNLIKLTKDGTVFHAEKVYANSNMSNHHGGVLLLGDYVYGHSYQGTNGWACLDFKTGEVKWKEARKLEKGGLTCADGHLYCFGENEGTVVLVEASPDGWKESGRFKLPQQTKLPRGQGKIWTHPVVANGKLYLRDQDLLFCFDVKDRAAANLR
jgi:outer membrane protein assembly factor BamB